ncbi:MAG: pyridoxamine 5'-phosphate oxidase family protein, partial [bacterium]
MEDRRDPRRQARPRAQGALPARGRARGGALRHADGVGRALSEPLATEGRRRRVRALTDVAIGAPMADLADLLAFLDAHHVAHLATSGEGGPHAAPVFFARVGVGITWISAPHVLHSRHLADGPAIAASVSPSAPSLGLI